MFNIYSVQYVGSRRKLAFREVNTYRCNIYRGWIGNGDDSSIEKKDIKMYAGVIRLLLLVIMYWIILFFFKT